MTKKNSNIVGIILAAGMATRMGSLKQVLPIGGVPVVRKIGEVLTPRFERVLAVVGHGAQSVQEALVGLPISCVHNPRYKEGMLSSVQTAVKVIGEDADFLICLGDQPSLRGEIVDAVVRGAETSNKGIVIPVCSERRGHPLFLHRSYGASILALPEGVGLNAITRSNPQDTAEILVDAPEILDDMDTPEDYQRELNRMHEK